MSASEPRRHRAAGRSLFEPHRERLPLDFFSWHCYAADPRELARRATAVRKWLDAEGFPKAESHLNEWNYLPGGDWSGMLAADPEDRRRWYDRLGGAEGAAFAAAALVLLQDAPVDAANYFIGPATDILRMTVLKHDEILTSIRIPNRWAGARFYFEKVADRKSWDFPLVNVASSIRLEGNTIAEARIDR